MCISIKFPGEAGTASPAPTLTTLHWLISKESARDTKAKWESILIVTDVRKQRALKRRGVRVRTQRQASQAENLGFVEWSTKTQEPLVARILMSLLSCFLPGYFLSTAPRKSKSAGSLLATTTRAKGSALPWRTVAASRGELIRLSTATQPSAVSPGLLIFLRIYTGLSEVLNNIPPSLLRSSTS